MKEKEMYISVRDRIKLKITFFTIEKKYVLSFQIEMHKKN